MPGNGGARALVPIGVMRWLTENSDQISATSVTSAGALIGGIDAAGKRSVYADWVPALERLQLLRLPAPNSGRDGLFQARQGTDRAGARARRAGLRPQRALTASTAQVAAVQGSAACRQPVSA